jgi:uncharacterized protein YqhQ
MVVKIGGQALADGVLMRTSRAWAIARADGSVEVGEIPPSALARIPVLRVVAALFGALRLAAVRGLRNNRGNRRFLAVIVGLEAGAYLLGRLVGDADLPTAGWAGAALTVVPWIATLAVLRLATPSSLWRYHGAEHKAVAAHEQGIDTADTAAVLRGAERVHARCGTNLVFLMLALALVTRGQFGGLGWLQIPLFLGMLGAAAELVTLASARPDNLVSRVLLGGGKALQRWVTTAEPTAAEQAVGCHALEACLAEHARITHEDAFSTGTVPVERSILAAAA